VVGKQRAEEWVEKHAEQQPAAAAAAAAAHCEAALELQAEAAAAAAIKAQQAAQALQAPGHHAFDERRSWFFWVAPDACTNPILYWLGSWDQGDSFNLGGSSDQGSAARGPFKLDYGNVLYAQVPCWAAVWSAWGRAGWGGAGRGVLLAV
jgi:hypothetical protein